MLLTTAQLTTLKTHITASGDLNTFPNDSDGDAAIAALMNLDSTTGPDAGNFWVWKTGLTKREITQDTSPDGTTFIWNGNGFIGRTTQELISWQELFGISGSVDASRSNIRAAFTDIFSGTGNAAANRAHLLSIARRKASRAEHLFATGTGSTASPGIMGPQGDLTGANVQAARALP